MTRNKSNPKREHHELPLLYLQGFCEGSFFWIYRRGKPYLPGVQKPKYNPYKAGIREVAKRDRYTLITQAGNKDFEIYEDRLQKEEHKSDDVLGKMHAYKPISNAEKEIFAQYIQLINKRTSEREKAVSPIIDRNLKSIPWDQVILQLAMSGQFKAARELSEAEEYLKSENSGKKHLLFESMLTQYPLLHKVLMTMKWTFYIAPAGLHFVTSNTPVIFDRTVGLRASPLLFPVSSSFAMIATWNGASDLQYVNASSDETLIINFLTICHALEVYSPKQEKWIWDILDHGLELKEKQLVALRKLFPFRNVGKIKGICP